ncbi:MAG: hypothetical protein RR248_01000 [Clostridia bacterium]
MYNPFEILGLTSSATREEVDASYRSIRETLRNLRFESGSVGEEASEKLQQLEQAYSDCLNELRSNQNTTTGQELYDDVKDAIKASNFELAQQLLDGINTRDAEWHYIQSTIFFNKNWFVEAKKQLEYAISLEPNNTKYTESLDKLTRYLASNNVSPDQLRTTAKPAGSSGAVNNGTCTGSCCGDVCLANLCTNCLCGGCN